MERKPPQGVVHHRIGDSVCLGGLCEADRKYMMLPSMSRPANPYDNAFCESFMKTLKHEEITLPRIRILTILSRYREVHRPLLQSLAAAFGFGLSDTGGV